MKTACKIINALFAMFIGIMVYWLTYELFKNDEILRFGAFVFPFAIVFVLMNRLTGVE